MLKTTGHIALNYTYCSKNQVKHKSVNFFTKLLYGQGQLYAYYKLQLLLLLISPCAMDNSIYLYTKVNKIKIKAALRYIPIVVC